MKRGKYRALAHEWFQKAQEDYEAARLMHEERFYGSVIVWHAHQAVEKYLKGFLVWHTKDIEDEFKIHNLLKLYEYAHGLNRKLAEAVREACFRLNKYYLAARYPTGADDPYTDDEIEAALKAATLVREAVKRLLKIRLR